MSAFRVSWERFWVLCCAHPGLFWGYVGAILALASLPNGPRWLQMTQVGPNMGLQMANDGFKMVEDCL